MTSPVPVQGVAYRALRFAGQITSAAILPLWTLIIASTQHGSLTVMAIMTPFMTSLTVAAGLGVIAIGVWWQLQGKKIDHALKNQSNLQGAPSGAQQGLGLLAGIGFFAAMYATLYDFTAYSDFLRASTSIPASLATPWTVLLVLCGWQFVFFLWSDLIGERP